MRLSNEFKIGIIITIAIAVTIWGLNFLKGRNILKSVDTYYTVFENIGGLEENNKIFLNGYRIGQVGGIVFDANLSGNLIVSLDIEQDYKLIAPAKAILYDADLLGTKAMEIIMGDSDLNHEPGDTLDAIIRLGLSERLEEQLSPAKDKVEDLITTVDSLMTAMAYVFDRESADLLKSSIRKMESSVDGVNVLIANLESITSNLKVHNEKLAAAMSNIESITDSIARSDLKETIKNTNRTLVQTQQIMEKINNGEGTLGLLVNNDTLYNNISALSGELDLLLKDLQDNPKKYINVSVFGKSDKKEKK